jgi:HrpA-like RNA helicase
VVLMSATADANLFASYFESRMPGQAAGRLAIPGFTHPVKDMFLEDALEATGLVIGKTSKWAMKGGKGGKDNACGRNGNDGAFSSQTMQSLENVDESLVNVDLIEALVAHLATGGGAEDSGSGGARKGGGGKGNDGANAILVFAPGADEIGRIVRTLQQSGKVAAASPGGVRVLPLHGGLPPSQQTKVFERPPRGEYLSLILFTAAAAEERDLCGTHIIHVEIYRIHEG